MNATNFYRFAPPPDRKTLDAMQKAVATDTQQSTETLNGAVVLLMDLRSGQTTGAERLPHQNQGSSPMASGGPSLNPGGPSMEQGGPSMEQGGSPMSRGGPPVMPDSSEELPEEAPKEHSKHPRKDSPDAAPAMEKTVGDTEYDDNFFAR